MNKKFDHADQDDEQETSTLHEVPSEHIFPSLEREKDYIQGEWGAEAHIPLEPESQKCDDVRSVLVKHGFFVVLGQHSSKVPIILHRQIHQCTRNQQCSSQG